jgi:GEVED domain/Dockerin type I domain/Bacterial pre-peptidase C-terminal domain
MSIAGSGKVTKLNAKLHQERARNKKRELARRIFLETLEARQLMAVGPQLISVQPNEGSVITDNAVYHVSPNEFVFRFDDTTSIDPTSLGGIRISRAGSDGVFDRAYVSTDLGTAGQVVVDFAAANPGLSGNGIELRFTKASYNGTRDPRISVVGRRINVELNVNGALKTRAQDLIKALNENAAASALVTTSRLRGSEFTTIADTIPTGQIYRLDGANAARASTNFNAGPALQVEFLAESVGPDGRNVQLVFTSRDRGGLGAPVVTVNGSRVNVELNSNQRAPSTALDVINAINGNAAANALVKARLVSGAPDTRVGGLPLTYSPIVLAGANDLSIIPAYVGLGDNSREVIMRFAEPLPDDVYRIDILGQGASALRNVGGDAFNGGVDKSLQFELDLGARIESVVPQPVVRNANGTIRQLLNEVHVYFNDDDLDIASATNVNFYQLRYTKSTATGNDDIIFKPSKVEYSAELDRAILTFNRNLNELVDPVTGNALPISFMRLRIGTNEERLQAPTVLTPVADPGNEFASALNIAPQFSPTLGQPKSIIIDSEILNTTPYTIDFPGSNEEPGNRNNRYQQHVTRSDTDGIEVIEYNFQGVLGRANGSIQLNAITDSQKERVREIMSLYSNYMGVRFQETAARGITVAVGDMRAVVGGEANQPGGQRLVAGPLVSNGQAAVVVDIQDFNSAAENEFGTALFRSFMQGIGTLLGLGQAEELPNLTTQSNQPIQNPGIDTEMVFPGNHDIVHGQFVHRPEGKDIDLYRFSLPEAGELRIETFAERQVDSSLLDTYIRLYQRQPDGSYAEISANNDYYSEDSQIRLRVNAGNYIVGISAKGNETYDPRVVDSGLGGKSEGKYQVRIDFRPPEQSFMIDSRGDGNQSAVRIDGDADGRPGGAYDFWFVPTGASNTIYVDKAATAAGNGTIAAPYRRIQQALAAATPGKVIRIVGNGGVDNKLETTADNLAYEIGFNRFGQAQADGATFDVPKDVTVMIDAGAILKLNRARVSVGSTSVSVDRSGGSLQVLGLPRIIDTAGRVVKDLNGDPMHANVYFTSLHERIGVGVNSDQNPPAAAPGDWGGIDFRNGIDGSDETRRDLERNGLFLNSVIHGNLRFGGGQVVVDGVSQSITPIQMIDSRPTIANNRISNSSNAAMSATPDSFRETNFHDPNTQSNGLFVADYERVGPDIFGNRLSNNSINGLFVKVRTAPGSDAETMKVAGRFDDSDIVHVISENLIIAGTPGGPVVGQVSPPSVVVTVASRAGGSLVAGTYNYKLVYVDAQGNESPASEPTASVTVVNNTSIVLSNLPPVRSDLPFVARRIYRSDSTGGGTYRLVAQINAISTSFVDNGQVSGAVLNEAASRTRARLNGSLTIDPGMILKLQGSRIEVQFGAQLLAEGVDGRNVVMTSMNDIRYGAGGTFDTANRKGNASPVAGDWGGIYVAQTASASLDYARLSFGGGVTRTDGFASFNTIEAHQADVRIANSRFESNADGTAAGVSTRGGRGTNFAATIFVRGSQPILVNNRIVGNTGPAINIDVNSLNWSINTDSGRSSGAIGKSTFGSNNFGPLVRGNTMDRNGINGMVVRGQELTTQSIWDDSDIVHVVFDEIIVPDFHVYGGLRLQSAPNASLVVKFSGGGGNIAGITATGRPLDIEDRIGGAVQIVGQPGFPVVLTSLADDSVGAGFTPDGLSQNNTDGQDLGGVVLLPIGPEVNNGTLIDNDVASGIPGQFAFRAGAGGRSGFVTADGVGGGITAQGNTLLFSNEDAIFEYFNFIDVGADGQAFELGTTTITQAPTLVSDDLVVSQGTFPGVGGAEVRWRIESRLDDGIAKVINQLTLTSDAPLGNIQFINYLDEDVLAASDDLLYLVGTAGQDDFRAFTLDGPERIGFAHGGVYASGSDLVNATYEGWAADEYDDLLTAIQTAGTQYTVAGNIDLASLPAFNDPTLGNVFGLRDITTAFTWRVDPNATSATMTSFLELVATNPGAKAKSGDWRGVELQTYSNDRNVGTVLESESGRDSSVGANDIPGTSQFLGQISNKIGGGDENARLGFEISGTINKPSDLDVYSFLAAGGTEVWLDIDRTSNSLDTVVELIDANGNILALSNDSFAEEADPTKLYRSNRISESAAHPLRKTTTALHPTNSSGTPRDLYSTNTKDAGFRVILPGQANRTTLYHIRVRSNNMMPGDAASKLTNNAELRSGQSSGSYQLQIRLSEQDEVPGSSISHADIRFAENGLSLRGVPRHSPLLGEVSEQEARDLDRNGTLDPAEPANNDVFTRAQELGNILETDRQAISLAGNLQTATDVDWFTFSVDYQLLLTPLVEYLSTVFDVDYADGIGRPDTALHLFSPGGTLLYSSTGSNLVDDRAAPLKGADNSDLTRGSSGTLDPFLGTVELSSGRYFLAVTSARMIPRILFDPLVRLQPVQSTRLLVEDHVDTVGGSTGSPPVVPQFLPAGDSVVEYTLSDVPLYVSQDTGFSSTDVRIVNPFTGEVSNTVGRLTRDVRDIAFRFNGSLQGFVTPFETLAGGDKDTQADYVTIDSATGAITVAGNSGIETFHPDPANPLGTLESNVGINFEALVFADLGAEVGFAVGNRGPGPSAGGYNTNILYQFAPNTGAATSAPLTNRVAPANLPDQRRLGAGTQIVERGQIFTGPQPGDVSRRLVVTEATQVIGTGPSRSLISDGTRFTVRDATNFPYVFEFDSGPELRVSYDPAGGRFMRDGDQFTLDGVRYEFDTGGVLVMSATDGAGMLDGTVITITDNSATPVVKRFEFDRNNSLLNATHIRVPYSLASTQADLIQGLIGAINTAGFAAKAELLPGSNRITVSGKSLTSVMSSTTSSIAVDGNVGVSNTVPAPQRIAINETMPIDRFVSAIAAAMPSGVKIGFDGDRLNFAGANTGVFTSLGTRGVAVDLGSSGGTVTPGAIPISFLAQDTDETIATRVASAINAQAIAGVTAQVNGRNVIITFARFEAVSNPLKAADVAPGGTVTGIAVVGGSMFAVSDNGGLYRIGNPTASAGIAGGQIGSYVRSSSDLLGITFTGLTAGPRNLENGRFADLLFGTDATGTIYAFDTSGRLAPVFANGASSVSTGVFGLNGLSFSTLDYNLWHQSQNRRTDAGHGLLPTPDGSRTGSDGGTSWYFGFEAPFGAHPNASYSVAQDPGVRNSYNFPGGALGVLESRPFSLAGIASEDLPALYFNYFLETEGTNSDATDGAGAFMRDSFRVYLSDADGGWQLLATTNSDRGPGFADDEFDPAITGTTSTVEVFDNTTEWRQAKVDLSPFAGQSNVKLRFEFSTAGGLGYGRDAGRGPEIRLTNGSQLRDGDQLTIGGKLFEIEMGPSLIVPPGSQLANGMAVTIEGTRFVFFNGVGTPPSPGTIIPFSATESAVVIAQRLFAAIQATTYSRTSITGLSFSNEAVFNNDTIDSATATPIVDNSITVSGRGRIGDNPDLAATPDRDVDMLSMRVTRGTQVTISTATTSIGSSLDPLLRVFDSAGRELQRNDDFGATKDSQLVFIAPADGTYYVGVSASGNSNYNAAVFGSGNPGASQGLYDLTFDVVKPLAATLSANRIQLSGASNVVVAPNTTVTVEGSASNSGIPVYVNLTDSANDVGNALRQAVAQQFSAGVAAVYNLREDFLTLTGLGVADAGPFTITRTRTEDLFSEYSVANGGFRNASRAQANDFEGVYIDDFIIGVAERGELVLGTTDTTFVDSGAGTGINVGPYQLEIRGSTGFGNPQVPRVQPTDPELQLNGTIDINGRLVSGQNIQFRSGAEIGDGETFSISDGVTTMTFEFEDDVRRNGVGAGHVAVRYTTMTLDPSTLRVRPTNASEIASIVRDLINSSTVQSVLNISAISINGDLEGATSDTLAIFGNPTITMPASIGDVTVIKQFGDQNRDRDQGQIIVESTRFSNSAQFGLVVSADSRDSVSDAPNPGAVRNTVVLNSERLVPGAVIRNNEFIFNAAGGIDVSGDAALANRVEAAVPFARIYNNTIVGGTITRPNATPSQIFGGTLFSGGVQSFGDTIVSYSPNIVGGPSPIAGLQNTNAALGIPNFTGTGEPTPGQGAVSLGRGGQMIVQFTNNYLFASGDSRPDLYVFEVGNFESVKVEVSSDGVRYKDAGTTTTTGLIDLDAVGILPAERFFYVRLTDIASQGDVTGDSVGADIDAVGAIFTRVNEIFTPGGQGIRVQNNASPTLLNNVLVNNVTGIDVAADSDSTVVGGSLFSRNTANINGTVASNQFTMVVGAETQLFVDPVGGVFYPFNNSPAIDSSINSLNDRQGLIAVKQPLGLNASPIIAPSRDINGLLRVDDPNVETPAGLGENVFKDRGAADRADSIGPSVFLVNPQDNDSSGADLNPLTGVVELVNVSLQRFDIQLIDGAERGLLGQGSGVDDNTVTSSAVIVYKNNQPLVEGVDYRFGYDSTNNIIRLTPLAGVWRNDSSYKVRLIGKEQNAITLKSADGYLDGNNFSVVDAAGKTFTFELDFGYQVQVPVKTGGVHDLVDGSQFVIDNGTRRVTFEYDSNGSVANGSIRIAIQATDTPAMVAEKTVDAITSASLQVTAATVVNGLFQIGGSRAVTFNAGTSGLTVVGQAGATAAYGVRIPTEAGLARGITDGQKFTITNGSGDSATIELDTNGSVSAGAVAATFADRTNVAGIANAIVAAIRTAALGLNPTHTGNGFIAIGGDSETRINVGTSVLQIVGTPGSVNAIPVPINLATQSDATQIAAALNTAMRNAGMSGVQTLLLGSKIILQGARGVTGDGATVVSAIRDIAGNQLLPNQNNGDTEVVIFLGEGLDYGDAPDPPYSTNLAKNGPRHKVVAGFSLGATVSSDADARSVDTDDGIRFNQQLTAGFSTSITVTASGITASRKGFLSAWIDFDGDGQFETSERIVVGQELIAGVNPDISFRTPAGSKVGQTYARFRYSSSPITSSIGPASDGEVEDYAVNLNRNPYQNPNIRADVNGDGRVSPIDALQIINFLNTNGRFTVLPFPPTFTPPPFIDTTGDGAVAPDDALLVINYLNAGGSGDGGEGEADEWISAASVGEGEANASANSHAVAQGAWCEPVKAKSEVLSQNNLARNSVSMPAYGPQAHVKLLDETAEALSDYELGSMVFGREDLAESKNLNDLALESLFDDLA